MKDRDVMAASRLVATYYTLAGPVLPGGPDGSPFGLAERADAAAAVGYAGIGLSGYDLEACLDRHGAAGIRRIVADAGLDFLEIECMTDWFATGDRRAVSDRSRAIWLGAAEAAGINHIKVCGDIMCGDWPIDRTAEEFRTLCDQAAEVGVIVSFEIFPVSNVADIATGTALVTRADAANGGLLLDIWHITRPGIPYAEIATIPPRFIKHVELDDAAPEIVGDLFADTVHRRLYPGEGSFDVPAFLRAIRDTGYDGHYGVEILSDANRLLSPREAAERSYRATAPYFETTAVR